MAQFLEKCTKWHPNDLDMFKVKNTNMHTTYIPEAQIFVRFALWQAGFELRPNLHKSAPNDAKVKNTNMHVTYTSMAQIFVRFALRWVVYELWPIFRKVHRMTPTDLDMFKIKNTNMHVTYTPGTQIFVCFALRQAVFELWPNFQKSAPNDPTWPWHVPGQKYQHIACYR